jgi:hypothetical protein
VTTRITHPLGRVAVGRHLSSESVNVDNYRSWVGDALIDEIHALSRDLKGLRICNVNATAAGGGVAELLSRIIPVHLALGISTDWRLIYGDKDFFTITKSFHNALQGGELKLSAETKRSTWIAITRAPKCFQKIMTCLSSMIRSRPHCDISRLLRPDASGSGDAISTVLNPTRRSGSSCTLMFRNTTLRFSR